VNAGQLRSLLEGQPDDMPVVVNVNSIVGQLIEIVGGDALPPAYIGDPGTKQYVQLVILGEWVPDPDA
jgi:hypothetical protein